MYTRNTTLAQAFYTAAQKKVDHQRPADSDVVTWRVVNNAQREYFGTIRELDHRPIPPHLRGEGK
jgi:hypothetical protein